MPKPKREDIERGKRNQQRRLQQEIAAGRRADPNAPRPRPTPTPTPTSASRSENKPVPIGTRETAREAVISQIIDLQNKARAEDAATMALEEEKKAKGAEAEKAIAEFENPLRQLPEPTVKLGAGAGDFAANVATNIPAIAAGAGTGAAAGSLLGPIGTVGGAVIGGLTALSGKIAFDKRQTTKEAKQVFTRAKGARYTELLNMANSGQYPSSDILLEYEKNHANILEAERELKKQTNNKIGKQLSGAQDELNDVQDYLRVEWMYRNQLLEALRNPDPSRVYAVPQEEINPIPEGFA